MPLNIEQYDEATDSIVIEGTRYAGCLFRELGCSFPNQIGQVLRIDKKENGLVTVTHFDIDKLRADLAAAQAEVAAAKKGAAQAESDFIQAHENCIAARAEVVALRTLLAECAPVIESEAALADSMARHMAGGFPESDVAGADASADKLWDLNRRVAELLKEGVK